MDVCDISNINNYYNPSDEVIIDDNIYKSNNIHYDPPYVTRQNGQMQLTNSE